MAEDRFAGLSVCDAADGVNLAEALLGLPAGVQVAALKSLAQAPPAWVVEVLVLLGSSGLTGDIRATRRAEEPARGHSAGSGALGGPLQRASPAEKTFSLFSSVWCFLFSNSLLK